MIFHIHKKLLLKRKKAKDEKELKKLKRKQGET